MPVASVSFPFGVISGTLVVLGQPRMNPVTLALFGVIGHGDDHSARTETISHRASARRDLATLVGTGLQWTACVGRSAESRSAAGPRPCCV
jgi:hypothetical protein